MWPATGPTHLGWRTGSAWGGPWTLQASWRPWCRSPSPAKPTCSSTWSRCWLCTAPTLTTGMQGGCRGAWLHCSGPAGSLAGRVGGWGSGEGAGEVQVEQGLPAQHLSGGRARSLRMSRCSAQLAPPETPCLVPHAGRAGWNLRPLIQQGLHAAAAQAALPLVHLPGRHAPKPGCGRLRTQASSLPQSFLCQ